MRPALSRTNQSMILNGQGAAILENLGPLRGHRVGKRGMQDRRNEYAVKSLNRSAVGSVHAFVRALSENALETRRLAQSRRAERFIVPPHNFKKAKKNKTSTLFVGPDQESMVGSAGLEPATSCL
jgi:hypothetical protein